MDAKADKQERNQYLTFMLGKEVLAIGILAIKEILEYEQPTDIPMMPGFIRGVINLRGAVVPVVDLAARLHRATAAVNKKTCIVIVEASVRGETQVMGVVVDAVNEVLEIATSEIEPPPAMGSAVAIEYLAGLGRVEGKFVIILDVDKVLTIEQFDTLEQAAASAAA